VKWAAELWWYAYSEWGNDSIYWDLMDERIDDYTLLQESVFKTDLVEESPMNISALVSTITQMTNVRTGYERNAARPKWLLAWGGQSVIDMAVQLENVYTYWYQELIDFLVPYYDIAYSLFLKPFFTELSQNLIMVVFGPNRMSRTYASLLDVFAQIMQERILEELEPFIEQNCLPDEPEGTLYWSKCQYLMAEPEILVVGHGAGGLVAKGLGMKYGWSSVAFEAPAYERSPMERDLSGRGEKGAHNTVNIRSEGSFLTMLEPEAKANILMPSWQSYLAPAKTYETMCLVMAGCVEDNVFDHLCANLIGEEQYWRYFDSWDRPRNTTEA
jgi:hypothetical protein